MNVNAPKLRKLHRPQVNRKRNITLKNTPSCKVIFPKLILVFPGILMPLALMLESILQHNFYIISVTVAIKAISRIMVTNFTLVANRSLIDPLQWASKGNGLQETNGQIDANKEIQNTTTKTQQSNHTNQSQINSERFSTTPHGESHGKNR